MWELLKDGGVVPADMPVPPKRSEVIAELKAELKDIARETRVVHKHHPRSCLWNGPALPPGEIVLSRG